jgi:hypothetical protein
VCHQRPASSNPGASCVLAISPHLLPYLKCVARTHTGIMQLLRTDPCTYKNSLNPKFLYFTRHCRSGANPVTTLSMMFFRCYLREAVKMFYPFAF